MQLDVARGPQLPPALEADFQNVGVDGGEGFDPDHSVGESAAPSVRPRTVEIAGRITGWPHALGAVLAPGQNRAEAQLSFEVFERTQHLAGNLRRTLNDGIGFSFVHGLGRLDSIEAAG